MSITKLHPKIQALRRKSGPVQYSEVRVGPGGRITEDSEDLLSKNIVHGYLIVWGVRDSWGTKFLKGCCSKSIQTRGPKSGANVPIKFLWQHDIYDPLSLFDILEEDDYGLYFRTVELDDVPNAKRTITQLRSKTLDNYSAGFNYVWDSAYYDDTDDSIVFAEIDLREGSVVTFPAIEEAKTIRSVSDLMNALDVITDDTEIFISGLPREKRYAAGQIFARYKALLNHDAPDAVRRAAAGDTETPPNTGISKHYDYLIKNLVK